MNNPRQSDKLKKQNDFLYKTHRGNIALNRTSSARLKYCVCCFKKHLLRCLVPVISLAVSVEVGVECDLTVAWLAWQDPYCAPLRVLTLRIISWLLRAPCPAASSRTSHEQFARLRSSVWPLHSQHLIFKSGETGEAGELLTLCQLLETFQSCQSRQMWTSMNLR